MHRHVEHVLGGKLSHSELRPQTVCWIDLDKLQQGFSKAEGGWSTVVSLYVKQSQPSLKIQKSLLSNGA